jgi:2,3-bisphosphoglycerate-independent phosphoglycerate mutase
MNEVVPPRPVVLAILDGWGDREQREMNAIRLASTPNLDRLNRSGRRAQIDASEVEVGLPSGQMGNSEVGHMNLGAGRVVLQDLPRVDEALAAGTLTGGTAFQAFVAALERSGGTAHLMGLLSPGGVHSHQDHMAALANALLAAGVPVEVHAFLDGRDTPPRSALDFLARFESATEAPVATVSGRYFAMDRDRRWERLAKAYRTLVMGRAAPDGQTAATPRQAIEQAYEAGAGDEFVLPTAIGGYAGMADGDGLLMANFRADRARQILRALLDPAFDGFRRDKTVGFAAALGMVGYSDDLDRLMPSLLPPLALHATLGEVVSQAGLAQLRIAETEKYAHVTFFFNGGREAEFDGEERILVPSPHVATYDLQPEMSAPEVTDRLCDAVMSGRFDLIVVNYANGDMVGHTGNLAAAITAVEAVDACLGRLANCVAAVGGCLLVTSDHGNVEQMDDPATGQPHTAHTMNRVPALLVNAPAWVAGLSDGRLADVAPTLLQLMRLSVPPEMTGRSLIRAALRAENAKPAEAAAE